MAPYDVPHVAHDMIMRFAGFNFSAINAGSALIPSSLDHKKKPIFIGQADAKPTNAPAPGKTPEQDKAMWEGKTQTLSVATQSG
jgi:carboxypeptidase D